MTTLQQIRDELLEHLIANGPYYRHEISACSFDVLEGTSACAIVFLPGPDTRRTELAFGSASGTDQMAWSIEGGIYIKDTGDSAALLARVWQAHDDFVQTMSSGRTLGDSVDNCNLDTLAFDPRSYIEAGGFEWAEIRFALTIEA